MEDTRMVGKVPITFEEYKRLVSLYMIRQFSMEPDDLPDFDYWSCWNDGMKIPDCVEAAVDNATENY
jgi:hypothetical protein